MRFILKALAVVTFLLFAISAYSSEYVCRIGLDQKVMIDTGTGVVTHQYGLSRPSIVEIEKIHSELDERLGEIFVADGYLPVETFDSGIVVYFQRYILRETVRGQIVLDIENLRSDDNVMSSGAVCTINN